MLVIDASVMVKLLVDEPLTEAARQAVATRDDCIAPDLIHVEIASALAKKVRLFGLPVAEAMAGLESYGEFIAQIVDSQAYFRDAMSLSIAIDHSLFDCLYLALAIDRRCPLLTADVKFADRATAAGLAASIMTLR